MMISNDINDVIFEILLHKNINHELYVATWDETKWITLSSGLFMIPAIYSYYNDLYFYAIILVLTTIISVNFWRHATYSWRRIIDCIFSKFVFIFSLINGIFYVTYMPFTIAGYLVLFAILYCYYLSNKYCGNNPIWWKYHILFHLFTVCIQFIIINGILSTVVLQ